MCGICGFVGFKDQGLLEKMTAILAHRGPDDRGFYYDNQISLGHRRLSIIDLSIGGHQPLISEDKGKILVCNGEIYNYQGLMGELKEKGHKFVGCSDNEVILHGFEEWGIDVVNKLVGMFAFCLWDKQSGRLILGRDHLGIKPLYYFHSGSTFIFASEAKAILAYQNQPSWQIDPVSLDYYLSLRYVPGNRTMFVGLKKLTPGSLLIFKNGQLKINRFWQPEKSKNEITDEQIKKRLRFLLEDSVAGQMIADVPVSAYLSGGLDSSVITALAQKQATNKLDTFSLTISDKIDESPKARKVAQFLKTNHHQSRISKNKIKFLPKIVSFFDEPIGDPIILPLYLLARQAGKKAKVVLTGEGADEIFGGYIHYLAIIWKERIKRFSPLFLMKAVTKILPSKILDQFFPYPAAIGAKGKQRLIKWLATENLADNFLSFGNLFSHQDKQQLYSFQLKKRLKKQPTITSEIIEEYKVAKGDLLTKLIIRDLKYWLPDYILTMNDRLTMACNLEARVPYLDHRVVDFVMSLPSDKKIKGFKNKRVLRQLAADLLPKEIIDQPKQAFFFPIEQFLGKDLQNLIDKTLSDQAIERRGVFNVDYVNKLKQEFDQSPLLVGKQLMALIILELWFKNYYDKKL